MKKLVLILPFLLMFILCACVPDTQQVPVQPPSDAVTQPAEEITEPFQETGPDTTVPEELPSNVITTKYYTLTLPEDWMDKCVYEIVDQNDGTYNLNLYELTSHEEMGAGKLCSIILLPTSEDWADFPNYTMHGVIYTPKGDYQVIALFPTDVQFTENTMETYNALADQLMDVIYTIWPVDGIEMAMP